MIIGAARSGMSSGITWLTRALRQSISSSLPTRIARQSRAPPYSANPPQHAPISAVSGAPTRDIRSPGLNEATFSPTSSTRPTLSCPRMPGYWSGRGWPWSITRWSVPAQVAP